MNEKAVLVENLSKQYRIGRAQTRVDGRGKGLSRLAAPFRYLATTLRKPSEAELIWAVKDVTFTVDHGEAVGIIGRNGAGKSTLLRLLSRITEPTYGRAVLHGRAGSLLEVGTGFHPELTGRENIYLSGAILGMRRAEVNSKFDEIVAFSEVEKFLDTPVKRYSSGMYVRLAFAVAAHLEPEILLVDEVLSVGDATFQKKCLGKMGDVATEGRTVLFVSHNMVAVQNLCQRAIWIHDGRIRMQGPTQQVAAEYLSAAYQSQTERLWADPGSAPGNEKVRLRRIRVHPQDLDSEGRITMGTPLEVEIEYWSLVEGSLLTVGCRFSTDQNEVAFTTASHEHMATLEVLPLAKGLYRSVCVVPANLLNEGGYRIQLLVYQDRGKVIYRNDDVLTFEVMNEGKRPGLRYVRESGAVRPLLAWTTDLVEGV